MEQHPAAADPTSELAPDREGWQTMAQGLALLVALGTPLVTLVRVLQTLRRLPVAVEVATPLRTFDVRGASLPLREVVVEVVPSVGQSWALAAIHLTTGAFLTIVAYLLYRVLWAAQAVTGPFDGSMSGRLSRLATVVLVGGIGVALLNGLPDVLLDPYRPGLAGLTGGAEGPAWLAVAVAAVIGSMAAVFRHGEELEDDLDGLV